MKKISACLIFILILFFLPFQILAQDNNRNVVLAKNEVVNKDYFAAGNTISLEGTVNGDAYLAGGNMVVDGTINGDLIAAGGNLDIRGTVAGNIRAVGGNINLNGNVGRNVSLAGGSLNFASGANITGSLAAAGGSLTISSPVGKEANLAGGQVTLNSKISSDVNAAVDQLSLTPQANVNGNLTYWSRNSASVSQGATVSGRITQNIPQNPPPQEQAAKGAAAFLTFFKIASFILAAIIGLLLLKFLPVFFEKTTNFIIQRPWASLGIGFLTVVAFPFIFILLLITIIGIPVAFFLAFILAILLYLAKIFVAFMIGQLIVQRFNQQTGRIWIFLLGLLIYYIVTLIPILGWLISVIVGLIGLGAILIEEKNYYQDLRGKKLI